jgi:adenine-specific DNA-methyltransferase
LSNRKQRLELTWIGKDERTRLEPRILLEEPDKSYHAKARVTDHDIFNSILIHGDNLLALKALEQEYTGKVKCIFIDPPYNTGSAFAQYDDGIEHSLWLSLMRDRLDILCRLLSDKGSIWITIDDNEAHYLKVLCDEIFGRQNFICSFAWEKDQARHNDALISSAHDQILLYAKNAVAWRGVRNLQPRETAGDGRYKNPDNDPRGPWLQGACSTAKSGSERNRFPIVLPSGRTVVPPAGNYWRFSEDTLKEARSEGRVYFGKDGDRLPIVKTYLNKVQDGFVPKTWWPADEVGSNQSARRDHLRKLLTDVEPFATPKPEALLQRIILIATNPGELVLDSFAGSGTTGAVAQKMGRRWIMVELGDHCDTHIVPRLRKVIDGADPGGVTEAVEWKGGGGFRYYRLAPSLLEKDEWGNWVIAKSYDAAKLSQAVCKLMGFAYEPDETRYWMQGRSSETDFIYVTTQNLTHQQLTAISEEVGEERTLLVCCKAFRANADAFPNLTIKKIPQAVLRKCEWGHDDYSLNVANLPETPRMTDADDIPARTPKNGKKRGNVKGAYQNDLFKQEGGK